MSATTMQPEKLARGVYRPVPFLTAGGLEVAAAIAAIRPGESLPRCLAWRPIQPGEDAERIVSDMCDELDAADPESPEEVRARQRADMQADVAQQVSERKH